MAHQLYPKAAGFVDHAMNPRTISHEFWRKLNDHIGPSRYSCKCGMKAR
jgi:hypothetical protein